MDSTALIEKVRQYLPQDKVDIVESAYLFAAKAHEGQVRKSGSPYLEHPVETAQILADLQLDFATIAAALLHDVSEDCQVPLSKIETEFGTEVSKLVEGVTKLSKLLYRRTDEVLPNTEVENLRKMLIAMAEDLRVVFIKLADRLHNMRTLGALSPDKRRTISQETLDIYAPLAHRMGMWEIKWQLEDLAFRYLEPDKYHEIAGLVSKRRAVRESFIAETTQMVIQELEKAGIKAKVLGRPKHIFSIYNKINKYNKEGKDFGDIHDLFALRVLVDTVPDCYKALGVMHNLWHPLPEEFSDYIANPKENGYQSLHTTVLSQGTTPLEIQIRTLDMHRIADYGIAAHWRYKESGKADMNFENKISWLRQLIEWQTEMDSDHFLQSLKTDIFIDQVFVFTPKGEIKALPRGATPLDFAYRIHTELGHRCIGSKVNGKLVPLNHELKNGEIIEIMITKSDKGPSLDWLNSDLGYVKTSHAQEKIRQWFKKQERAQNIERGSDLLEKESKRLGLVLPNNDETARIFNYATYDDFLAALGYGGVTVHQLVQKLTLEPEPPSQITRVLTTHKINTMGVQVMGVGDLLTRLAPCCHPLPGDDIIGFITRAKGISIHRKDCTNIISLKETERLVNVQWGKVQEFYPVDIEIDVWDRVGLLRDLTALVAEEKVNIDGLTTQEHADKVTILATLDVKDMTQLNHILSRIRSIHGVISANRASHENIKSNQEKASIN